MIDWKVDANAEDTAIGSDMRESFVVQGVAILQGLFEVEGRCPAFDHVPKMDLAFA